MGLINILTKRCRFCKSSKDTKYITAYGIYGGTSPGDYYHPGCLKVVSCNPENHPDKIDLALDIIQRIEEKNRRKKEKESVLKSNCEKLKNYCIIEKQ